MPALDHARAIADAVLRTGRRRRSADSLKDAPTQAVLRVLEQRGLWFMVWDADAAWSQGQVVPRPRKTRT